ncbi:hypothetical protein [Streptomyces sp. NPDC007883]|uniref:hypothetical protein n=1 Tax=Streptomyces sp. NPDC007883 TaxID=3155116 RepID=UPI0033D3506E
MEGAGRRRPVGAAALCAAPLISASDCLQFQEAGIIGERSEHLVRAALIYQHLVNGRDHAIAAHVDEQIRKVRPAEPDEPSGT